MLADTKLALGEVSEDHQATEGTALEAFGGGAVLPRSVASGAAGRPVTAYVVVVAKVFWS